jgi:hypothetical protein
MLSVIDRQGAQQDKCPDRLQQQRYRGAGALGCRGGGREGRKVLSV